MGHTDTIAYEPWPTYDEGKTADDTVEIVVQINGKLKAKINAPVDMPAAEVIALAKADETVANAIVDKTVVKEISVPNKIVNIVVR